MKVYAFAEIHCFKKLSWKENDTNHQKYLSEMTLLHVLIV